MDHYRAVVASTLLKSGYQVIAQVRLIRSLAEKVGMAWPSKGLPAATTVIDEKHQREVVLTIEDLLACADNSPQSSTFRNHNDEYRRACHVLTNLKAKYALDRESVTKDDRAIGDLLHVLLNIEVCDPRVPIADGYKAAVDLGYEDLKRHSREIGRRVANDNRASKN